MSNGVRSEGSPTNNALEASLTKSYNHTVMPYLRTTDAVPFMNRRHSVIRLPIRDDAAAQMVVVQPPQPYTSSARTNNRWSNGSRRSG